MPVLVHADLLARLLAQLAQEAAVGAATLPTERERRRAIGRRDAYTHALVLLTNATVKPAPTE